MIQWRDITPKGANGPGARSSHAVSVVDGVVYAYGGEKVPRIPTDSAVWKLKLATEGAVWEEGASSGSVPVPRVAHAQAAFGKFIFVFGGRLGVDEHETAIQDFYRYDTTNGEWTAISGEVSACPRSFHRMIAGPKGSSTLYVFGGCGPEGRLADLHRVDLKDEGRSAVWTDLGSPSIKGRGGPGLYLSEDEKRIVVVGGFDGSENNEVHRYDISTNTWVTCDPSVTDFRPRSVFGCTTWRGKGLFVFGGEVSPSDHGHEGAGGFASDVLLINDQIGTVTSTIAKDDVHPQARGWGACDAIGNEGVVIYGGLSGSDEDPVRLADVWVCSSIS